ncbi:DUF423 domain-containing protein [Cerasicoccus arenae]|uniref:DUF423 domain-containing protein n=1 Tax=Cerasicoccus arenae TaxID=424488 RepID=UPI001677DD55|nr:DUF423 domain-containing protein [Cerasicoccus arenae]MBK1856873.1 DUF423 domain-containing protein [Cerasicoccus arenae]
MSDHNCSTLNCSPRIFLAAAVFAFLSVLLGAFGAHGLKATLESHDMLDVWKTAVDYQFWHALALLALSFRPVELSRGRTIGLAAWFFGVGVVLFSGSLYWLALGGPKWLGPVTPLGGACFLAGWGILAVFAAKRLKSHAQ